MKIKKLFILTIIGGLLYCPLCKQDHAVGENCPNTPDSFETTHGPN